MCLMRLAGNYKGWPKHLYKLSQYYSVTEQQRKMNNKFFIPIAPSTSTGGRAVAESTPYQPPDFWPTVNILRETMYRFLSLTPERYDLPRRGENRDLDKCLAAFIERHLGPKVSF